MVSLSVPLVKFVTFFVGSSVCQCDWMYHDLERQGSLPVVAKHQSGWRVDTYHGRGRKVIGHGSVKSAA